MVEEFSRNKWGKNKYKIQFEKKKKSTEKYNVGAKACTEKRKEIEERPDPQKKKGGLPSGQDPIHLGFQLVRKGLSNFLLLKYRNKGKLQQM